MIPGIEPTSSATSASSRPTHQPVADAGDQRQRHRMRDVAARDPRHRQLRIEDQQRRRAERAGADRRDRDQHAERGAEQDGPAA